MAKDVMGCFCEYVYANVETLTNGKADAGAKVELDVAKYV